MISIEQFKAVEAKIGTILSVEKVENADKLLRLSVDFGEETGPRQILSGIAEYFTPESLVGKQCPFITNLEPRTIRGFESQGMILAGGLSEGVTLLHPDREVPPGTMLR